MKAMVLCAGMGTRLGGLTRETPKPLLPVGGEPLLAHTLRHLAWHGFTDVVINVHYRAEQFFSTIGSGECYGVRVTYSHEPALLGTAGSVRHVAGFFSREPVFLVMHGDVLTDQNLTAMRDFHLAHDAPATILLQRMPDANSQVAMDTDGRITGFVERPAPGARRTSGFPWVNTGIYMFAERFLDHIPVTTPSDLARDIFTLAPEVELYGYPLTGFRMSIDSPDEYHEANAAISEGRCPRARGTAQNLRQ